MGDGWGWGSRWVYEVAVHGGYGWWVGGVGVGREREKKSIAVSCQHHPCYPSATWLRPIHHIKHRGGKIHPFVLITIKRCPGGNCSHQVKLCSSPPFY